MDKNEIYDKIKAKLIECATSICGIVDVNLPDDIETHVVSFMRKNLKYDYTDTFFSELLSFLNGINLNAYGRGLDIKVIPQTKNIQITLHDYKFIPIVPASFRQIKPFSPYCLALIKFIDLMNDLALMCQEIILKEHPDSEVSVKTIIPTDMLSSFHKSKQVCESQNDYKIKSKIEQVTQPIGLSDTSLPAGGGSKSRRRHRRKPVRKTRRGRGRKCKSKSKTHRCRRHSRVRKYKKNTSSRR